MGYKTYLVPTTKAELIKALKPHWNGLMHDLRTMSIKRLRAIFHTVRQRQLTAIMQGKGRVMIKEDSL